MTAKKHADVAVDPLEQAMRDQEALRANRELAAYFKGRRTEREARAALKIIKAFVRDRERLDPKGRPPLPGRAQKSPAAADPRRKAKRPKARSTAGRKGVSRPTPISAESSSPASESVPTSGSE